MVIVCRRFSVFFCHPPCVLLIEVEVGSVSVKSLTKFCYPFQDWAISVVIGGYHKVRPADHSSYRQSCDLPAFSNSDL